MPGSPGIPQPGTLVFTEDFENRDTALPIRLTAYTGATGMTYTADPPWLQNCNGWVASFNDPGGGNPLAAPQVADCTPNPSGPGTPGAMAWNQVRTLAQALGTLNGLGNANHAVSAYTNGSINNGNPGPNFVEFQTAQSIPLPPTNGRFLTLSVNASETSCLTQPNHAMLDFFLINGPTTVRVTDQHIEPCTQGTQIGPNLWVGSFTGNAPTLFTGASVGIQMRNAQGSGIGNDHAFDDIRLLDVTPQLDKSFDPTSVPVGATSRMTFTITNTDDLFAKQGWSFTDTLPAGLTLASPANATTTCSSGTVIAPDGGTQISIAAGGLEQDQAFCTVSVDVTSAIADTYTNDASNITADVGLNLPGSADVTFTPGAIALTKSASPTYFTASGQTITFTYRVTNTGTTILTDVAVADSLPGVSAVDCPDTTLAPGESTDCTATYQTTQQDVERGSAQNAATAQGTPPSTSTPVVSQPAEVTVPAALISLRKSVNPTTFARAGDVLRFTYVVTNTGTVTLEGVTVADSLPAVSAVVCPQTTLAPGASQTCTATYTVTATDITAGSVRNSAVASGTPPGGTFPATSAPSSAVAFVAVPVTG